MLQHHAAVTRKTEYAPPDWQLAFVGVVARSRIRNIAQDHSKMIMAASIAHIGATVKYLLLDDHRRADIGPVIEQFRGPGI